MKPLMIARVVLTLIGVAVWGYGYRMNEPDVRLAGIGVLALSLLLRFVPKRLLGVQDEQAGRDANES